LGGGGCPGILQLASAVRQHPGCDFFGYVWGTPPSFLPTAMYDEELKVVNAAFAEMQRLDAAQTRNMR
jgi:hypothetical protein